MSSSRPDQARTADEMLAATAVSSCNHASKGLLKLPNEIIDLVVSFSQQRERHGMTLTCRRLCSISMPWLYRSPLVEGDSNCLAFASAVLGDSTKRNLVETLHFWSPCSAEREYTGSDYDVLAILKVLPNISNLHITGSVTGLSGSLRNLRASIPKSLQTSFGHLKFCKCELDQ